MATKRRGRPRQIDLDVQRKIEELALEGRGPTQIFQHLQELVGKQGHELFGKSLPGDVRTIQRIVAAATPRDTSGPWSVADANGDDAALVLPVLAAVVERTEGRRRDITKAEAAWIVKLRRAAPDLTRSWPGLAPSHALWTVYFLARLYLVAAERKQPTDDLDAFLAFAPWRGDREVEAYRDACLRGWAPTSWTADALLLSVVSSTNVAMTASGWLHDAPAEEALRHDEAQVGPAEDDARPDEEECS